jgi:iron complex outermembrane recepter protein
VTTLQFFGGTFRPVDIAGNPSLSPETALTWNLGGIVRAGDFRATVDYWSFDFQKPLVAEPFDAVVNTMFPGGLATNCGNPAFAGLQARFTFSGVCNINNVSRLRTNWINGADQKTSGIDVLATYDFPAVDAASIEGLPVQPAFDAVGLLNQGQSVVPMPQWKAQLYADFTHGMHNLRITANYINSYIDQRTAPFVPLAALGGAQVLAGKKIEDSVLVDLSYRAQLPWDSTLVLRVANVFDSDPAFARLSAGYDPFTGNPLGRTFKVILSKKIW